MSDMAALSRNRKGSGEVVIMLITNNTKSNRETLARVKERLLASKRLYSVLTVDISDSDIEFDIDALLAEVYAERAEALEGADRQTSSVRTQEASDCVYASTHSRSILIAGVGNPARCVHFQEGASARDDICRTPYVRTDNVPAVYSQQAQLRARMPKRRLDRVHQPRHASRPAARKRRTKASKSSAPKNPRQVRRQQVSNRRH